MTAVEQEADWQARYRDLQSTLLEQYRAIPDGSPIRLAKRTSNLFRPRDAVSAPGLDVAAFDGVLHVDPVTRTAEVLGMTTYEHLVDATLPYGLMPMCVPQLRTITLGGAVTGLGIESASFRNGTPHESVLEMDILTGDGEILTVTGAADDPHRDLFFGFPNSYGSLGYALRLRIELEPTKPYVLLRHVRFAYGRGAGGRAWRRSPQSREFEGRRVDFLDGTVFSPDEQYLSIGTMVDRLPDSVPVSDYTGMGIYYRSIQAKPLDALTIHDYLWRWDTDWFWCSRAFLAQKPAVRRLWPKSRLRSDVYWKLVAIERRHDLANRVARRRGPARARGRGAGHRGADRPAGRVPRVLPPRGRHRAHLGVPAEAARRRLRDGRCTSSIPTCSTSTSASGRRSPLPDGVEPDEGRVNRRIEQVVTDLDGRKSLYSTAFYDRETFRSIYGGVEYDRLKSLYDSHGRLRGLYEKVVERQCRSVRANATG